MNPRSSTYVIYKPFGMISQFTKELPSHVTLKDLDHKFEKNVYPVGRLDSDSEGLLLLSNEEGITSDVLDPDEKIEKTYWAQVEGEPSVMDLAPLRKGITIKINKNEFKTAPASFEILNDMSELLPERNPPIRFRKNKPTAWVQLVITEGKNRQVRKMFAKIGFPVLRLVRVGIGNLTILKRPLINMQPGQVIKIDSDDIFKRQ